MEIKATDGFAWMIMTFTIIGVGTFISEIIPLIVTVVKGWIK